MKLHDVNSGITKYKKRRRIGRGTGSGRGKTAGRGHKGQGSRSGWSRQVTFQGGTMPMVRRVPKRGFTNSFAPKVAVVNVEQLDECFSAGDEVNPETLAATPLLGHRYDQLKVLGNGELTKQLKVSAHGFSKSAVKKIEAAGGAVVQLPSPTPVEEKKRQSAKKVPAKKMPAKKVPKPSSAKQK